MVPRGAEEIDTGDPGDGLTPPEPPQMTPRQLICWNVVMSILLKRNTTTQVEPPPVGLAGEPDEPLRLPSPFPELELEPRCSGRQWQFPQIWRDFEATSYSPITVVHQTNEQVFEERVVPPQVQEQSALLSAPDMAQPSLS